MGSFWTLPVLQSVNEMFVTLPVVGTLVCISDHHALHCLSTLRWHCALVFCTTPLHLKWHLYEEEKKRLGRMVQFNEEGTDGAWDCRGLSHVSRDAILLVKNMRRTDLKLSHETCGWAHFRYVKPQLAGRTLQWILMAVLLQSGKDRDQRIACGLDGLEFESRSQIFSFPDRPGGPCIPHFSAYGG